MVATPQALAAVSHPGWRRWPPHRGCVGLALTIVALQAAGPDALTALRYDRAAILQGEWWRLWSAGLVHLGWTHCLLNAGALMLLAQLMPARCRVLPACLLLSLWIGVVLLAALPDVRGYAGLSGVGYGLAVIVLWPLARHRRAAAVMLALLAVRAAWQTIGGPDVEETRMLGGPVVGAAHLAGLSGGLAWMLLARARHA